MKSKLGCSVLALIFIFVLCIYPIAYISSEDNITITVKETERITKGSGESITSLYLVFTEDEVFENTDTYLYWKFNSTDFHNYLEVGKTYNVKVVGWRVPFLSWYRNIVEIKGYKK